MNIKHCPEAASSSADEILSLVKQFGAIRFQGPYQSPSEFKQWSSRFEARGRFLDHHSPTIRRRLITESGRPDNSVTGVLEGRHRVSLHTEFGYRSRAVGKRCDLLLFAGMDVSSDVAGGETLVACGKEILRALPPALRGRLMKERVTYQMHMSRATYLSLAAGGIWAPGSVERFLQSEGYDRLVRISDELATYIRTSPAVEASEGEISFCNSIVNTATSQKLPPEKPCVFWESGEQISREDLEAIEEAQETCATGVKLGSCGDTLILDNAKVMHGRAAWTGSKREIATRFLSLHGGGQ